MPIDLLQQGLEGDDALRNLGASSAPPNGGVVLVGVEDGGQAYRAVRATDAGGVRVAPIVDWGNGATVPLLDYRADSAGGSVEIGTIEAWRYPALYMVIGGTRSNRAVETPVVTVVSYGAGSQPRTVGVYPILADTYNQGWVVYPPPSPTRISVQVSSGDTWDDAFLQVYPLYPPVSRRDIINDGFLVKFRSQAYNTNEVLSSFHLPPRYRVTLRLDVNALPTGGSMYVAGYSDVTNIGAMVWQMSPVYNAGESSTIVLEYPTDMWVRALVYGTAGSADFNVYAYVEGT